MAVTEERIMVCVDNSVSASKLQSQIHAIQLYCYAKLKSNPNTGVGVVAMAIDGLEEFGTKLYPTSDFNEIMASVKAIGRGGKCDLLSGTTVAALSLNAFTGGAAFMDVDLAKLCGNFFKERGIAVDLVNLCPDLQDKLTRHALNLLVALANNNQNSHIKHVAPGSSMCDVLSSTPAIVTSEEIATAVADLRDAPRLPRKEEVIEPMDMIAFFEGVKRGNALMLKMIAV